MSKLIPLEKLEKQGLLDPWAQTHEQRLELVRDLDHLTEQFLQCEQVNCPDLKELYLEGVSLIVALKEPKVHWNLRQCIDSGKSPQQCLPDWIHAYNRWYTVMDRKIEEKSKGYEERRPAW